MQKRKRYEKCKERCIAYIRPYIIYFWTYYVTTRFWNRDYYCYDYYWNFICRRVSFKFFFKIGIVGVVGIIGLIAIAPYRLARILSFLDPWKDPLGSGFQIIQSLYAIGPGGLLGLGFGNSIQKHFYLPEPQTDFIFSIISEEFGFLGVLIVASLFLSIIINGFRIAHESSDLFGKYLAFGIIFQLSFQAILNLCVVVGLIPVTGVTLPFLSYGGSSLLITLCSMGIVLNISRKK